MHHFSHAFSLLSKGELLGQACSKSCVEGLPRHAGAVLGPAVAQGVLSPPSPIPRRVLGVLPVQLSDVDYDQLSSFLVFQSQFLPALSVQDTSQAVTTALSISPSSLYLFPKHSLGLCWAIACVIAKPHLRAHPMSGVKQGA